MKAYCYAVYKITHQIGATFIPFIHVKCFLSTFCKCNRYNIGLYNNTLESGIDVGQGIIVEPGKFVKKNKRRALNKRRA